MAKAKLKDKVDARWVKCPGDVWCDLFRLDMDSVGEDEVGVYIIWKPSKTGRAVRVGKGNIKDRLTQHKNDRKITRHAADGVLLVTWAILPAQRLKGVEKYLGNVLDPLEGQRFPDVRPITVNLPW